MALKVQNKRFGQQNQEPHREREREETHKTYERMIKITATNITANIILLKKLVGPFLAWKDVQIL